MLLSVVASPIAANATIYAPNETLEPDCAPGSINCGVAAPAVAGANSDITSLFGLTTPLSAPQGGTGLSSYTIGDLLFALSSSSLAPLPIGTNGQVLKVSGGLPVWAANNAATATALETPRTINGVSFDGTSNITIDAAAGSLTGDTLAPNVLNSSLTSVGTLTGLTDLGTTNVNTSGSSDTNIGTGTNAGTVTIGNPTTGNLVLNDPNWSISGNGDAIFTSIIGPISGNATTATTLQTPRTINGVLFDGSSNITIAAAAGTLTGTTLASNVVNSSLTSVGTLTNLTVTNPISGSITGNAAYRDKSVSLME